MKFLKTYFNNNVNVSLLLNISRIGKYCIYYEEVIRTFTAQSTSQ